MKYFGVLVPVVTPCSKDGELDIDGLKAVCDEMLEAGCKGIFVAGSTGRGPWFGADDKARICRFVAEHIGPDVPLFAGCMASGLPGMLENARVMADNGAQNAVLTSPGYFNYNQQEIESIFLKFADDSPLPVMVYDIPVFAGSKLDTNMVKRLAKHEKVIGFKDSSADFERFEKLLSVLDGDSDFYLIQGKEHLLAKSILGGASGITVSLIHIDPRLFVALCQAAHSGDAELARRIQVEITKVMNIVKESFARRPEISTLMHIINYALKKRGVCDNVLLAHEGQCPGWIAEQAEKALEICKLVKAW